MNNVSHFRYSFLLAVLLVVAFGTGVLAQHPALARLQQQVDTHRNQTLQEKLFVHTDRQFYLSGDVMWFRLFYVDGVFHRPLDVSKIAYLELLDTNQKSVLQTKVPIDTGSGMGSLSLPVSLLSGQYVLRAYTYWMKTVSPDFLFEKAITIVNPFRKLGLPVLTDSLNYDVQFFPEGGNLVTGLPAKVAFKVVDPRTGRGVDCKGVLLNQANDTIARFTSLNFGMGTFAFTPSGATSYRVQLKDGRGRSLNRALPAMYERGYTLQLEDVDASQLRVTVRTNQPANSQNPAVYLIGHTRQVVKVADVRTLQSGQATFLIAKNGLGEGISHLTVFDAAAQPVCERLYFKRPQPNLTIQLKPDRNEYTTRAPVALALTTVDPAGKPVPADVSVSVYRLDSLESGEPINLPDYLWLTSELRGTIESPGYYLTHTGSEADAAIDNLMLTHGWRRFRWETALQPKPLTSTAVPEHGGLTIWGRITNARTGAPANGVTTHLSVPGKAVQLYSVRSNEQGLVRFEMANFYGSRDVVLQTATPDSTYRVDLINPYTESPATTHLPVFDLDQAGKDQLVARSLAMQVQRSYYPYTVPAQPPGDSAAFYGVADERYALDAFTRFTVMEEVLSEYVPGVLVRRRDKHFVLRVMNQPYKEVFSEDPLLLLDGVPVFDTDRLMAFSPLKIRTLDVITRRYFLGYTTLPGIISFRTYKGDLAGFQLDPRAVQLEYDGLQARREFYAPQYATPQQLENRLPDFRTLLHWNPQVRTGAPGKADLTFYTSDQDGNYLIVVQGMTADGRFSSARYPITVRSRARL